MYGYHTSAPLPSPSATTGSRRGAGRTDVSRPTQNNTASSVGPLTVPMVLWRANHGAGAVRRSGPPAKRDEFTMSTQPGNYPVTYDVEIPPRERNRLTCAFRVILAIPH